MRLDIKDILFEEIERTRLEMISSMKINDQYVTGKTAASLHTETTDDSGILYGADYFDTLETGISPFQANMYPFRPYFTGVDKWMMLRGIDGDPMFVINKHRKEGSVLFRAGGRTDVFTNKVNPLTQRIGQRLTNRFVNIKILP